MKHGPIYSYTKDPTLSSRDYLTNLDWVEAGYKPTVDTYLNLCPRFGSLRLRERLRAKGKDRTSPQSSPDRGHDDPCRAAAEKQPLIARGPTLGNLVALNTKGCAEGQGAGTAKWLKALVILAFLTDGLPAAGASINISSNNVEKQRTTFTMRAV